MKETRPWVRVTSVTMDLLVTTALKVNRGLGWRKARGVLSRHSQSPGHHIKSDVAVHAWNPST